MSAHSRSSWKLGQLVFKERGVLKYPALGASEKNYNKLNPDVASTRGDSNQGHETLTTVTPRGDSAYERGGDARRKF